MNTVERTVQIKTDRNASYRTFEDLLELANRHLGLGMAPYSIKGAAGAFRFFRPKDGLGTIVSTSLCGTTLSIREIDRRATAITISAQPDDNVEYRLERYLEAAKSYLENKSTETRTR